MRNILSYELTVKQRLIMVHEDKDKSKGCTFAILLTIVFILVLLIDVILVLFIFVRSESFVAETFVQPAMLVRKDVYGAIEYMRARPPITITRATDSYWVELTAATEPTTPEREPTTLEREPTTPETEPTTPERQLTTPEAEPTTVTTEQPTTTETISSGNTHLTRPTTTEAGTRPRTKPATTKTKIHPWISKILPKLIATTTRPSTITTTGPSVTTTTEPSTTTTTRPSTITTTRKGIKPRLRILSDPFKKKEGRRMPERKDSSSTPSSSVL